MAQYEKIFEKPYEDGYEDLPSQNTPITASTLNDKDAAIEHIEDFLDGKEVVTPEEKAEWDAKLDASSYDEKSVDGEFETISGGRLSTCVIAFEPIQSGSGTPSPSNVRPITGHSSVEVDVNNKNYVPLPTAETNNGVTLTHNADGSLTIKGTASAIAYFDFISNFDSTRFSGYKFYMISDYTNWSNATVRARVSTQDYSTSLQNLGGSSTINDNGSGTRLTLRVSTGFEIPTAGITIKPMLVKNAEESPVFVPYLSKTYTIPLGGTYYGGSLDVVTGKFTGIVKVVDMGTLTYDYVSANQYMRTTNLSGAKSSDENAICSIYPYAPNLSVVTDAAFTIYNSQFYCALTGYTDPDAFKTAMSGVQLCYELATPITIQLTPQQIETLIGQNNISVPLEGQTLDSLSYREVFAWDDVNDVVDTRLPISAIGTDESNNDNASQAYSQGDYFYKNGIAKAKTSIASGATFTLGTNYEIKTLAEILKALES